MLRASECASLQPESFYQEAHEWKVRVKALVSKHRKEDILPVPAALVVVFIPWLKSANQLPAVGGSTAPKARQNGQPLSNHAPNANADQKCDQNGVAETHLPSSVVIKSLTLTYDATPCQSKGLSSIVIDLLQRARRGSNPQPPDRQSGTLTN